MCQSGEPAELFFGPEHRYIGAGHHFADGAFADTRKELAGHIGKHQVGQIGQVQHFKMVLPALEHLVDQLIEGLNEVIGVIYAGGRRQDLIFRHIFRQILQGLQRRPFLHPGP